MTLLPQWRHSRRRTIQPPSGGSAPLDLSANAAGDGTSSRPTVNLTAAATDVAGNTTTGSGQLLVAWPGDSNCDGTVAFADYQILEAHFGLAGQNWSGGDFDGDGAVSFADYQILESRFGRSVNLAAPAGSSPLSLSANAAAAGVMLLPPDDDTAAAAQMAMAAGGLLAGTPAAGRDFDLLAEPVAPTGRPVQPAKFELARPKNFGTLPGGSERLVRQDQAAKAKPPRGLAWDIQSEDLLAITL